MIGSSPARAHRRSATPGETRRSVGYLVAWWAGLLVIVLALGWLVTRMLAPTELGHAETEVSTELAADRTPAWNDTTRVVAAFGGTLTVVGIGLAAAIAARLAFHRWREPALIAVALLGEVTIFLLVTLLIDRDRPPVPKLDEAPPTSGYPSGHTAAAVVLYGSLAVIALSRLRTRAVRALAVAVAVAVPVLVAAARVYRGMHFVSDVLGGVVLGAAWLAIAVRGVGLGGPVRARRRPGRAAP